MRVATWAVGVFGILGLGAVTAYFIPTRPMVALLVPAAVFVLGLSAADGALVPLALLPLLVVVVRVGAGGVDLSASDAALFVATLVAIAFARRPFSAPMTNLLWLSAIYQFLTLFTVLANPFLNNTVEWFHAWLLVAGAALVGWTLGSSGRARQAMTVLLVSLLGLALITLGNAVRQYASGNFGAVYVSFPYGMHKNFVGTVLCFGALIAFARPAWMGWPKRWADVALVVFAAAILVTQSRQALLGLGAGLVFIAWRERRLGRKPWRVVLLGLVPILVLVFTMVRDQVETGNQFNSVFQRVTWLTDTIDFWLQSPWVGHGLRYWYEGYLGMGFQPPNAEVEMLASAGLVGLLGFFVLMAGTLVLLWRIDPRFGTVALAVLGARLVQAQVDLFWVAIQTSIPFLVVGICLGALDYHQRLHLYDADLGASLDAGRPTVDVSWRGVDAA